jgi:hypothetical protein
MPVHRFGEVRHLITMCLTDVCRPKRPICLPTRNPNLPIVPTLLLTPQTTNEAIETHIRMLQQERQHLEEAIELMRKKEERS